MLTPNKEQGRYVTAEHNGNELLCWLDYQTAQETPLCAAPNCEHNSEACSACITGDGRYVGGQIAALGEDQIVFTVFDNHHKQPSVLYAANRDGSQRHELHQFDFEDELRGLPLCADNEYFYLVLLHMGGQSQKLARMPLEGGTVEMILEPENEFRVLRAEDRCLLIAEHDWDAECYKVYQYNVDTGAKEPLDMPWLDGNRNESAFLNCGDRLYQCLGDGVHWVNMQGESGCIPVSWPEAVQQEIEAEKRKDYCTLNYWLDGAIGTKLLMTVNGLNTENGQPGARRFILDTQTGEMQESPLNYLKNEREVPIAILAQSEDALLAEVECHVEYESYIQPNGVPNQQMRDVSRYALIRNEDFLAGKNEWQEIQMQFRDHWF